MSSGIFASLFAGSWDRLMKGMTTPAKSHELAPTLPVTIINATADGWALDTTSSLDLAFAQADSASSTTASAALAFACLDAKPIIMASDQDLLPPALRLPSISESANNWADALVSVLQVFDSTSMDLDIPERAPAPAPFERAPTPAPFERVPKPAPIVETQDAVPNDNLMDCDTSVSDTSFNSLFDSPSRSTSPHENRSSSSASPPKTSPAPENHSAALILASEAFTLVPCTLEPRAGDINRRPVSGFLTFPTLINYQKPEQSDDGYYEMDLDTYFQQVEEWIGDDVSDATMAGYGQDVSRDTTEGDENTSATPGNALVIFRDDTAGSLRTPGPGQLDQQQAEEQDIPLLELFDQRRLADAECPITPWVENTPGLLTMGDKEDISIATIPDMNDELDAVLEIEWARYKAEYGPEPSAPTKMETWSNSRALAVIPESDSEYLSEKDSSFVIHLDDDEDEDC